MAKRFSSILALAVLSRPTTAQRNNLSATPPMGWMASRKQEPHCTETDKAISVTSASADVCSSGDAIVFCRPGSCTAARWIAKQNQTTASLKGK